MTLKTVNRQASANSSVPVVLFGVDDHGKPKAARFLDKHASVATKAAGQLNLQVLQIIGPAVSELAASLPEGRIHANGRGFVPYIRRDLYAKLVAAANGTVAGAQAGPPATTTGQSGSGQQPPNRSDGPGLPQTWDSIAVGHVVIVLDEPGEGWYEAIVTETNGDMLTMRWRHYPRERRVIRHRLSVGLQYPNELPAAEPGAQRPEFPSVEAAASTPQASDAFKPVYPKTWDDIDVDCLVLFKENGPWHSWWEGVSIAKADDQFLLRWREFPQLSHVTRSRWSLGLLYPNGR